VKTVPRPPRRGAFERIGDGRGGIPEEIERYGPLTFEIEVGQFRILEAAEVLLVDNLKPSPPA